MNINDINVTEFIGYSDAQLNQIYLGLSEGYPWVQYLSNTVPVIQYRLVRQKSKELDLDEDEGYDLVRLVNAGMDISDITDDIVDYFDGIYNIASVMNYDNTGDLLKQIKDKKLERDKINLICNSLSDNINLIDYSSYDIDALNYIYEFILSYPGIEIPESFTKRNFGLDPIEFLLSTLLTGEYTEELLNGDNYQEMDFINNCISNGIDYSKLFNWKLMVDNYSDLIDNDYNQVFDLSKLYGKEYTPQMLSYLYDILSDTNDVEESYKAIDEIDNYNNYISNHKIVDPYVIADLDSLFFSHIPLDDIDYFYNKVYSKGADYMYAPILIDLGETISEINSSIDRSNYLEDCKKLSFKKLLDNDFNFSQLDIIKKYYNRYIDLPAICDDTYSADQLNVLGTELIYKSNIQKALNSDYSPELMQRIIYYSNKGIEFENIDDYNKNYIKDKFNDYDIYINTNNRLFGDSNQNDEIILISILLRFGKQNKKFYDIDKMLQNRVKIFHKLNDFIDDLIADNEIESKWGPKKITLER